MNLTMFRLVSCRHRPCNWGTTTGAWSWKLRSLWVAQARQGSMPYSGGSPTRTRACDGGVPVLWTITPLMCAFLRSGGWRYMIQPPRSAVWRSIQRPANSASPRSFREISSACSFRWRSKIPINMCERKLSVGCAPIHRMLALSRLWSRSCAPKPMHTCEVRLTMRSYTRIRLTKRVLMLRPGSGGSRRPEAERSKRFMRYHPFHAGNEFGSCIMHVSLIEMRSGPRPWDVKQDQHGGHDKPGMGHGDHRLPGKALGEPLKGSVYPLNELHPAFCSRSKRTGWGGEGVKCSRGGAIRLP